MYPADETTSHLAREAFARFQLEVLSGSGDLTAGLYAEDIVIESPFARPGMPRRVHGLEAFAALARAGRSSLPVRFDSFRDVTIHDTADPETIVAEYELAGTATTTNRPASARFVVILTVDDQGRITHWREYADHQAMTDALAAATSPV